MSPADWIVASDVPWNLLVTQGPAGFPAYARLRFVPDADADAREVDKVDPDAAPDESEQWRVACELLAASTSNPEDCFFGLWDGWPFPESTRRRPRFSVPRDVETPSRSYFLFHGPLPDVGHWGAPEFGNGDFWEPAWVWPSDRTWCVAKDVDLSWAGIAAPRGLIDKLVSAPGLDVVYAHPFG